MDIVKLRKVGGSHVLTIPRHILRKLGWKEKEICYVKINKHKDLIVQAVEFVEEKEVKK